MSTNMINLYNYSKSFEEKLMKNKKNSSISNNLIVKNILYLIQGAIVGIGAILPGVSGGVLCVAFGAYEPMMELLTHPRQAFKKHYKIRTLGQCTYHKPLELSVSFINRTTC